MGIVYSGTDQALARSVAIKVIRSELLGNPALTARFHQEARAAAAIVHPNVVTVHDFGMEGKHRFIVMELLEGRTLRTELDSGRPILPLRILEILEGVCSAVEYAHRRRLLHRDLKPANIFLAQTSTGDVVKILDFGLVKILWESTLSNSLEAAGTIAGTPSYMAPELLRGKAPSEASDVWALGVIAYEMLTRELPFTSGLPTDQSNNNLNESFAKVHFDRSRLSGHLQAIFERIFEWDPARRISSARVFYSELEVALRRQSPVRQPNSSRAGQSI